MSLLASTAERSFGAARLQRLWSEDDTSEVPPGPGTVLMIVAAVDRPPDAWGRFSPSEEEALARLRRADDRAAYAMAHGLLRGAFARLTGLGLSREYHTGRRQRDCQRSGAVDAARCTTAAAERSIAGTGMRVKDAVP